MGVRRWGMDWYSISYAARRMEIGKTEEKAERGHNVFCWASRLTELSE
jgi:hypothetical protein